MKNFGFGMFAWTGRGKRWFVSKDCTVEVVENV